MVLMSLVLPPIFLLVALGACGVGHGNCSAVIFIPFLYPFAIFSGLVFGENLVGPTVFIAIVQFPLYVGILGAAKSRPRFNLLLVALSVMHLLAVLVAVALLWRLGGW
jgi:hypothetical protein